MFGSALLASSSISGMGVVDDPAASSMLGDILLTFSHCIS